MRLLPFAPLTALLLGGTAFAVPLESIPDPRPSSAVVDLTGTLKVGDQAAIDAQAQRGQSGGQLVVVVIDSVDEANPRDFTRRLFNRWKLGGQRNQGVLLLAALKDRKAEIVVGDGFAAGVESTTDAVMSGTIVPRFKAGDPRGAMVDGARALVSQLLLASEAPTVDVNAVAPASPPEPSARAPVALPPYRGAPASSDSEELPLGTRAMQLAGDNPLPALGGLGGVLLGAFLAVRRYLRNRPRVCPRCKVQMARLDEQADDAHLDAGERKEEQLESVDYDIWMCPECQHTIKERYGAFFTSYSKCHGCGYKTVSSTSRTITAATYDSSGLAEVTEDCKFCSYHRTYTRTIPRKQRPSSTRSSSSSFSSGSRSGGSSSGRGSSGSW